MNKVILIGRLTRDPEMKYTTSNNTAVCTFSLAVPRRFKKDETDFINITTWSKTAEFCNNYFTKGQQVAVVGRLQTRSWEAEDGTKRYATDVIAEEVYFCGSKSDNEQTNQTTKSEPITQVPNDDDLPF